MKKKISKGIIILALLFPLYLFITILLPEFDFWDWLEEKVKK